MHPGIRVPVVGLDVQPLEGVLAEPGEPPGGDPARVAPGPQPVRACGGVGHHVDPRRAGEPGGEPLARILVDPVGITLPRGAGEVLRGVHHVRFQTRARGRPPGGHLVDAGAQCVHALPRACRDGDRGAGPGGGQPVLGQQLPQRAEHRGDVPFRKPVRLVEDHHGDRAVAGERLDEVLVEHRVRVLLRVHDPHHHVHETHHALDDVPVLAGHGVEVGEVEQHETTRGGGPPATVPRGHAQGRADHVALRHVEPVEQGLAALVPPHRGQRR